MNDKFEQHSYWRIYLKLIFGAAIFFASPSCGLTQTAQVDYAIAANHYTQENWNEAIEAFGQLIRQYPATEESVTAKFFIAEILMKQEDYQSAFRAYQNFIQEHPRHTYRSRAAFRLGESAYRLSNYDVAIRSLEDFILNHAQHDLNEYALAYLGEIRLINEEPQLAKRAFETALRIYPTSTMSNNCRLGLAKALQVLGHEEDAVKFYQFLITQNCDGLLADCNLQLGIIYLGRREFDTAKESFRTAMRLSPSDSFRVEATYWLARSHNELSEYSEALVLLKEVFESECQERVQVAIWFDGAIAADRIDQSDLSKQWLKKIWDRYPQNQLADDAIRQSLEIDVRAKDTASALRLIDTFCVAYKDSPLMPEVLELEGRIHYSAEEYQTAINVFRDLLDNYSGNPARDSNWHYLKALAHIGIEEFENSDAELKKIALTGIQQDLFPKYQIASATTLYGLGKYAEAIPHYREYLAIEKTGVEPNRAMAELSICLVENGQWEEAKVLVAELQKQTSSETVFETTLVFVAEKSYAAGKVEFSETFFGLMIEEGMAPETIARGLSGLAWLKMNSEETDEANLIFERLLTEFPNSKFGLEAALARGKYCEDNNEFEEASKIYDLVIREHGESSMGNLARLRKAYVLQQIGTVSDLEQAEALLEHCMQSDQISSQQDEALYLLAWILMDLNRAEEAQAAFQEIVSEYSDSKYWSDSAYRVALTNFKNREFESAQNLVSKLIKVDQIQDELLSKVLSLYAELTLSEGSWSEFTDSIRLVQSRLKKAGDKPGAQGKTQYWLAESLYRQKKYDDSLNQFSVLDSSSQPIEANLEPWVLLRRAQCLGFLNRWEEAGELAAQSKENCPQFKMAYEFDFLVGRCQEDEGRLSDARSIYESIVASEVSGATETAAMAQWRIGETYFHQEEYAKAVRAYHKVDSLFAYRYWRSASLLQAGKCQELLGNKRHAVKLYTRLVAGFPESEFSADAKKRLAVMEVKPNQDNAAVAEQIKTTSDR
jgi:cellulose synthase operon protein C